MLFARICCTACSKRADAPWAKDYPNTLYLAGGLTGLLADWDGYARAEPLLRRTLEAMEHTLGKNDHDTLLAQACER